VLVFDNGGIPPNSNPQRAFARPNSRVLEINPLSMSIVSEYTAEKSGRPIWTFFSHFISSAQRQPNGNTLICEGANGRIFEVTPAWEIVWEYVNPYAVLRPSRLAQQTEAGVMQGTPGRTGATEWANAVFRAHRYGPDDPALQGRDLNPDRYANLNRLYAASR
jgi:hypothetical protein